MSPDSSNAAEREMVQTPGSGHSDRWLILYKPCRHYGDHTGSGHHGSHEIRRWKEEQPGHLPPLSSAAEPEGGGRGTGGGQEEEEEEKAEIKELSEYQPEDPKTPDQQRIERDVTALQKNFHH